MTISTANRLSTVNSTEHSTQAKHLLLASFWCGWMMEGGAIGGLRYTDLGGQDARVAKMTGKYVIHHLEFIATVDVTVRVDRVGAGVLN